MLKTIKDTHLDHNLTTGQVDYLRKMFADRKSFFIETVELPEELGTVEVSLIGPLTGGSLIPEDVVDYEVRNGRKWASRVVHGMEKVQSRQVTIIAGPHNDESMVVYMMYGGPKAPREPGDPYITSWNELLTSREFWSSHALVV